MKDDQGELRTWLTVKSILGYLMVAVSLIIVVLAFALQRI